MAVASRTVNSPGRSKESVPLLRRHPVSVNPDRAGIDRDLPWLLMVRELNLSRTGGNLGWLVPRQPPAREAKVYTAFQAHVRLSCDPAGTTVTPLASPPKPVWARYF
jgi:hypothetical protein